MIPCEFCGDPFVADDLVQHQVGTETDMSHVMRKPVFEICDLVGHKLGYTATEDGQRLDILDLGRRGIVLSIKRKQRH